MLSKIAAGLLALSFHVDAAVITPGKVAQTLQSQPTCACTQTVTKYISQGLVPRQDCPPAPTITVVQTQTIVQAPLEATVIASDPNSIAGFFASASSIESIDLFHQSQDQPSGYSETTPILFTATASGEAVEATNPPNDSTDLYVVTAITSVPLATAVFTYPPWDTPASNANIAATTQSIEDDGVVTLTTYLETVTVGPTTTSASNVSLTKKDLEKRQTCSMIFARIDGQWASWCNNWQGSLVTLPSTFETTILETNPPGADPIPKSVYDPSGTITSDEATSTSTPTALPHAPSTRMTSDSSSSTSTPTALPGVHTTPTSWSNSTSTEDATSTSTPVTLPGINTTVNGTSITLATSTSTPTALPSGPSSSNTSSMTSGGSVLSVTKTGTVVVTIPVTTLTQTHPDTDPSPTSSAPEASSSCGQVGPFTITFDDLPKYSTNNPNDTAAPPIFNPYDHFAWTTGYSYGPPPTTPFSPEDGNQLAVYNPADATGVVTASTQGRDLPGSFGAGTRAYNGTFHFNPRTAYVGCNNTSTAPCTFIITGYQWKPTNAGSTSTSLLDGTEVVVASQDYNSPGVCAEPPCALTQIYFDSVKFSGLSSLNIAAQVAGMEVGFYLDSFQAVWTDNTCDAGLERAGSRK